MRSPRAGHSLTQRREPMDPTPARPLPPRRYLLALLGLAASGCLFDDPGLPANLGDAEMSASSFDDDDDGGTEPQATTQPQPTTGATDDTGAPMLDCAWEQVATSPRPEKRIDAALALAPGGTEVLLYGGRSGLLGPDLADTWTFDGERWRLVDEVRDKKAQPGPRRGHAMVHDAARDQVLLFGGEYGSVDVKLAERTWIHDGVRWSERKDGPSARASPAMAYLPHSEVVVLFGGRTVKGASAETWIWNGQDWAKRELDVAPSPRFGHMMTLDGSGDVLLYGGCGDASCGERLDDTWRFDGERWEQLDTGAGEGLRFGGMIRETTTARTLRLGEGASWRWAGTTWSPGDAAEPAVGHFAVAELPGAGSLLFGGLTSKAIESDETWLLRCS